MIFKDRREAGATLARQLQNNKKVTTGPGVICSLLRGGVPVGREIQKITGFIHIALPSVKISHPSMREMAIGAVCFDEVYIYREAVSYFGLDARAVMGAVKNAEARVGALVRRFGLSKSNTLQQITGKTTIITDDGIATGSTMVAAVNLVRSMSSRRIIIAVPVCPISFKQPEGTEISRVHASERMTSISQFYEKFEQVDEKEVETTLSL